MSLRSKLRVDNEKANKGVKFTLDQFPNEDGTVPYFILASMSKHNIAYQQALRELGKDLLDNGKLKADNTLDFKKASIEEVSNLHDTAFVTNIVLGWGNLEPETAGVKVKYSKDKAVDILLNPDWSDLLELIQDYATSMDNYRIAELEKSAKN